jgi:hypothetical protein
MQYWPNLRFWNIALRTVHILVTGALFGGHVFDVHRDRLWPWLLAAVTSGAVLVLLEARPFAAWWCEVRGWCVIAKMGLLLVIPWCWSHRVWLLVAVLVLASLGSHAPRRWRHFSLRHGPCLEPEAPCAP